MTQQRSEMSISELAALVEEQRHRIEELEGRARSRRGISWRVPRTLAVTLALSLVLGGIASADIPDGSVINGCYTNAQIGNQHVLTIIDKDATKGPTSCGSGQTAISWNQSGPQGPAGPAGPAGAAGPQGPAGPIGLTGQGFTARGAWQPNTAYNPYDVFTNGGQTYEVTTAFTSGTSFDATNLALWAAQGAQGQQGPAGANGQAGPQGPAGAQGPQGPAGPSSFVSDLRGAGLSGADLRYRDFSGFDLTGVNLSAAQLQGAGLTNANLTNADLAYANLAGATGGTTADTTGVHWYQTTCPDGTSSNNNLRFQTCDGHGF